MRLFQLIAPLSRPPRRLHHASALGKVLGMIVSSLDVIPFRVGKLTLANI